MIDTRMISPRWLALAALALAIVPAAAADCTEPTIPPTALAVGAPVDGKQLYVVTGDIGVCDATQRAFDIALPTLHEVGDVKAQLALAGFGRRYGVHQIGFALGAVAAAATPAGVKIQYTATIDGLERYQLAYTLYLLARP